MSPFPYFPWLFLFVWLVLVPSSCSVVVSDIAEERLFAGITSWIDARYRGRLPAYLVRCPICLSHWAIFCAALFLAEPLWEVAGGIVCGGVIQQTFLTGVLIFAAIRSTIAFHVH